MKVAIIDYVVIVCYSNCFACKHVIISKWMFLDVSNITTENLMWAITLLSKLQAWKWTRTGNCKCQRICMECVQRRKQMMRLVLTRGYFAVSPVRHSPRTLLDLVQALDMGRIERVEYA